MSQLPSNIEKPAFNELDVEKREADVLTDDGEASDSRINAFNPREQRKIIFRIDCRLVLTLGVLYMISLMDRTNLGSAAIAG